MDTDAMRVYFIIPNRINDEEASTVAHQIKYPAGYISP